MANDLVTCANNLGNIGKQFYTDHLSAAFENIHFVAFRLIIFLTFTIVFVFWVTFDFQLTRFVGPFRLLSVFTVTHEICEFYLYNYLIDASATNNC